MADAYANLMARRPRTVVAIQLAVMLALALVLIPAMSPARAMAGGLTIKLLFLSRMAVLIAVATGFLRLRGLGWADIGLRRLRLARFALAVPLGLVASVVLVSIVSVALSRAGVRAADYAMFAPLKGRLGEYLFWLVPVTWGSAALGEELVFRGFLLDAVERILGGQGWPASWAAIVIQAALFGGLHFYQGAGGVATATCIGLVLGWVRLFSGRNLWAGIVIHGLIDSAAMTVIFLFGIGPT